MEPLTEQDGEQSQSGLLHLCQGLVNEQVSALNESLASMKQGIEAVQHANFQAITCQLDGIKQRADAHDKKMVDLCMDFVSQCDQEIENIRNELQAEKEERIDAQNKIWIIMKQLSAIVKAETVEAIAKVQSSEVQEQYESPQSYKVIVKSESTEVHEDYESPKSAETLAQMSSKSEGGFDECHFEGSAVSDVTQIESQVKDALRFSSHAVPRASTLQPGMDANPIPITPRSSLETVWPGQLDTSANAVLSSTGSGFEDGLSITTVPLNLTAAEKVSLMTECEESPNSKWSLSKEHSEFQDHLSEMFSDAFRSIQSRHSPTPAMPPADAAAQVAPATVATMGGCVRVLSPQMTPRGQHRPIVQQIQASVARQTTPRSPLLLTRTLEHASPITVQTRDPQQNPQAPKVHSAQRLSSRDALRSATYMPGLSGGGSTGTQSVPPPNMPGRLLGQAPALRNKNKNSCSQGGSHTCSISTGAQVYSGKRSPRISGGVPGSHSSVVPVGDGIPRSRASSVEIPSFLRPTMHADNP